MTGAGLTAAVPGAGLTAAVPGAGLTAAVPGAGLTAAVPGAGLIGTTSRKLLPQRALLATTCGKLGRSWGAR